MIYTYGGLGAYDGGAFSGKDPSKVGHTGAYMASLIAKTIVDAGLAIECQVIISYAISKADPVAFHVDTPAPENISDEILTAAARGMFPLCPTAMIDARKLRSPRYADLAIYGHFGRGLSAGEHSFSYVARLLEALKRVADQNSTDK